MPQLWPMKPAPCLAITNTSQTSHTTATTNPDAMFEPKGERVVLHFDGGKYRVVRNIMGEWS